MNTLIQPSHTLRRRAGFTVIILMILLLTSLVLFFAALPVETASASPGDAPYELADINPTGSGYPEYTTALDGKLYFQAFDGTDTELWVYDPSQAVSAGTNPKELADIHPTDSGSPRGLAALGGKLYFGADGGTGTGQELWVYDPAQAVSVGTNPQELADINPAGDGILHSFMAALDGKLYFQGYDGTDGELWVYDPAQAVTLGTNPKELADLNPGYSSAPGYPAGLDGKLYFRADGGTGTGEELWVYDPAQAVSVGTNPKELADIYPNASGSNSRYLAGLDGKLYFGANGGTGTGQELWVYDPSQAVSVGTNPMELADLNPDLDSNPYSLAALGGKLYFTASDSKDYELWVYDPAQAVSVGTNPREHVDVYPAGDGAPYSLAALDGKLYFTAFDGTDWELWVYEPIPVNLTVNSAADTDDGYCDPLGEGSGNQDCTLREAINAANADADASFISFAGDYTITLTSGFNEVTTEMTISGLGHSVTIDGNNHAYSIFLVEQNGILTLNTLTLQSGLHIIQNIGDLTVFNSTIRDGYGEVGGIWTAGSLTVANSTFFNNEGGVGAIWVESGTAIINNSTFYGNSGVTQAGAIYSQDGIVTINNSIIANNTGPDCYINNTGSFSGSDNLIDDQAAGDCAGISSAAATNLDTGLADNGGNTQTIALLAGSNAIDAGNNATCEATDQRGVARPQGTSCDIGAYELEATQTGPDYVVNTAADTDDGYCDLLGEGSGNQDCTLREAINAANADADAGIITFAADYTITLGSQLPTIIDDLTITGNGKANTIVQASTCDPTDSGATCTHDYTVMAITEGSVLLEDLTIRHGRQIDFNAGGIYARAATTGTVLNLTLDNVLVTKNYGQIYGGGIFFEDGNLTLQNGAAVDGNQNPNEGAGIYYYGESTLLVDNSSVSNNSGSDGAGIFAAVFKGGNVEIRNGSKIDGNAAATFYGGGIYLQESVARLTIDNSSVSGNTATRDGGAMYFEDDAIVTIQNNSKIENNQAALNGGGIYIASGGTVNFTDSTLSGNSALAGHSGAIFNASAGLTVTSSTLANNSATGGNGGAIVNNDELTVTNSTFADNTASTVSVARNGGAIYNNGTLRVVNSTFYNNFAGEEGGGIFNHSTGAATLINNTFSDNRTGEDFGDAVLNRGTLHISNNIIANGSSTCANPGGTIGTDANNLIEGNDISEPCGTPVSTADPMLGPLQDNGGPTETMALLPGSPAIDAGDNATCAATDQRGVTRPQGVNCDIGAVEMRYFNLFIPVIIR